MVTTNSCAETMALQALAAWGLQLASHRLVSTSENFVFRVDPPNGQPLVLRLHRSWYHNLEELISERQWTRALRDFGISTPIAVPALDGRDYVLVKYEVSGEARYAAMAQWVDGEPLAHIIRSGGDFLPHFKRLGRLAALIHNQAANWVPPSGFVRHSLAAEGLMGLSPRWGPFWASPELTTGERKRFEDLRRIIHGKLSQLDTGPATYSLIHADLHPGNLLVDGDHLHIIDFDDAGFGWHIYELAVGLVSYQGSPHFPKIMETVLKGYREIRLLDAKTATLLPLFLLVRDLAQIGWFDARPEVVRPPGLVRFIIERAIRSSSEMGL